MNIREISKPMTAKALNESLAKRFGTKIALEKFTLEQLENVRNKLRTQLSQVETTESFDSVKSEAYQKSKLFLDVLNQEIKERENISEAAGCPCNEPPGGACTCPPNCPDCDCKTNEAVDQDEDGDNDFDDVKIARMVASGMSKEEAREKVKSSSNESVIKEGAEDTAELVMAAKDMVDRVTGWMEDTAEMQTESMLELADAIRDEMGSQKSEEFVATVKPALESMYAAMESTRGSLTQGVGQLTGEAEPTDMMGAEPEAAIDEPPMEPTVDQDEAPADDGMGASDAAAGGEEPAGRGLRESKKKLAERSRRLGTILSKKK